MEKGKNPYQGDALQAVDFFIQLAEAIRACEAAKAKVVHRDLSPGNVIIAPNGSIKVIDFGVCWIEGAAGVTMDDESVGTHNYMAPECESGAEGDITSKTDLYSVGKLLWTAVTGQRAYARERAVFDGKSMKMMLPDKPDTFHLHALFEQTIRNSPTDRFPNAAAAIQEAKRIRYLISNHYPPLELLADGMCPTCGAENLKRIPDPYNQNVYSLSWFECEYCGHRFPCTKDDVARKRLIARKNLS
jgi:serine/threonine protein kinase